MVESPELPRLPKPPNCKKEILNLKFKILNFKSSLWRFPRSWQFWQSALLLLFLAGCAVGPNYHRPSAPSAPAWKEQPPWRAAAPKDGLPKGQWWSIFGDTEVNQYESQAIAPNQTIQVARDQPR